MYLVNHTRIVDPQQIKEILTGKSLDELERFAESLGEPAYRGRQLYRWIYHRRAGTFAEMTDLPAPLREQLASVAEVGQLALARESHRNRDRSQKFLFELQDGLRVETVYLPESPGETVCISSQVGCALGCEFCATGRMGFFRNLNTGKIVQQVIECERRIETKLTNIVFMGMGEPFHNYDNVVNAVRLLADPEGFAIPASRITVSTVGIVPMIERWITENPPAKLAISLHGTTDERRTQIMPVNKAYPLEVLMKSVRRLAHVTKFPVTFEYIVIAGLNDRREDAANLKQLLRNVPAKVNLIRLHPTGSDLIPSTDEAIDRFMGWLVEEDIRCTLRESRGIEDKAACGMLYAEEPFRPSKARAWERDTKR